MPYDRKFIDLFNPLVYGGIIEGCALDDAFWAASHKNWRLKCEVTSPYGGANGLCNEMAWFPADPAAGIDVEVVSAILDDDGNLGPEDTGKVFGMIQVWRDRWIWADWKPNLGSLKTIEWSKIECHGLSLTGDDDDGGTWQIVFTPWYAGYPPAWPTWLL